MFDTWNKIFLKREKGFVADDSSHALVNNIEQPKFEFVTEIGDNEFEIVKCSQELDLIADEIAYYLLACCRVIRGLQAFNEIFGSRHGLLNMRT